MSKKAPPLPPLEDPVERPEDRAEMIKEYLKRARWAASYGMTDVNTVKLHLPEEHHGLLDHGDDGDCYTVVFTRPGSDWAEVIERLEVEHEPFKVRYILPIGKTQRLLPPPSMFPPPPTKE